MYLQIKEKKKQKQDSLKSKTKLGPLTQQQRGVVHIERYACFACFMQTFAWRFIFHIVGTVNDTNYSILYGN